VQPPSLAKVPVHRFNADLIPCTPRQRNQRIDIKMPFEIGGDIVERRVDRGAIVAPRALSTNPGEQGMTLPGISEETVDIGAEHRTIRADRTLTAAIVEQGERASGIRPYGLPHMHFIAFEMCAQGGAAYGSQRLCGREDGVNVEQAEPLHAPGRPLDAIGIGDPPASI